MPIGLKEFLGIVSCVCIFYSEVVHNDSPGDVWAAYICDEVLTSFLMQVFFIPV